MRKNRALIREDILKKFHDLFGAKKVNGREVNVEQAIFSLTRALGLEISAARTARRLQPHSFAESRA